MLYSILIYGTDADIANLSKAEEERLIGQHIVVQGKLAAERKLGPVVRLHPSTTAMTLRKGPGGVHHRRPVRRDQGTAAGLLRRRLRHAGRSAGSRAHDRHGVHVAGAGSPADLVVPADRQHRSFEELRLVDPVCRSGFSPTLQLRRPPRRAGSSRTPRLRRANSQRPLRCVGAAPRCDWRSSAPAARRRRRSSAGRFRHRD